jgi:hypothetical protein
MNGNDKIEPVVYYPYLRLIYPGAISNEPMSSEYKLPLL